MTIPLDADCGPQKTLFLPFDPAEMRPSGLRLTRAEFARFLGVSKQAVGEWVTAGKIQLGADNRVDPRQAVSQLLRNSDPARLRVKVLAPLVRDLARFHIHIAKLEDALAEQREEAEFHEGAGKELVEQWSCLRRHLQEERAALAPLPAGQLLDAIIAWLDQFDDGDYNLDLPIADCVPVSAGEFAVVSPPCAFEQKEGAGESDE